MLCSRHTHTQNLSKRQRILSQRENKSNWQTCSYQNFELQKCQGFAISCFNEKFKSTLERVAGSCEMYPQNLLVKIFSRVRQCKMSMSHWVCVGRTVPSHLSKMARLARRKETETAWRSVGAIRGSSSPEAPKRAKKTLLQKCFYTWLMNKWLIWSIHPGAHSRRTCQSQLTAFATRSQCCHRTRGATSQVSLCHTSLEVCRTHSQQQSALPWQKAKAPWKNPATSAHGTKELCADFDEDFTCDVRRSRLIQM